MPLATMNRHGLIAGATGTGKTKTLQLLAEQLSRAGVPVLVADVKGDVSGLAAPAEPGGAGEKRMKDLGLPFEPAAFPVEFLALGGLGPGVPVRATVTDFGPQLLAKVLGANETQESSLALVFHYADAQGAAAARPRRPARAAHVPRLGRRQGRARRHRRAVGPTVGVLLRALVGLETGGGDEFFGEPQLDVADLLRVADDGRGVISCVELAAVQDEPALWSTALMWLVAELFEALPEEGDLPKPKLVVFLDEAHLLFDEATEAFLDSLGAHRAADPLEGRRRVLRHPAADRPARRTCSRSSALRVQHALRAFTPADAKKLRATVVDVPALAISTTSRSCSPRSGSARRRSRCCPSRACRRRSCTRGCVAPASRMDPADDVEGAAKASPLWARYGERTDAQSARELLAGRLERGGGADAAASRWSACRSRAAARRAAPRARAERRRRRRDRRLPALAPGQGAAEEGRTRHLRDAAQAALAVERDRLRPRRRVAAAPGTPRSRRARSVSSALARTPRSRP